jgi:hypothetical protein
MTGLSIDRPVFFFSMDDKRKRLEQYRYALRWRGKTKNAPWTILEADEKIGKIRPFLSGIGMEEYLAAIERLREKDICQQDIVWGGPPFPRETLRLERLELDPKYFQSGFFYNTFNKMDPSRAEEFLAISNNCEFIKDNISFGKKFRLVSYLADEVTGENGTVSPIIHILWESLKKQKIKKIELRIFLIKNRKYVFSTRPEFCQPGLALKSGDYIFGSVKMPGDKFKIADNMGISITVIQDSGNTFLLKIKGNRKAGRKGFLLLIPVDKFLPPGARDAIRKE